MGRREGAVPCLMPPSLPQGRISGCGCNAYLFLLGQGRCLRAPSSGRSVVLPLPPPRVPTRQAFQGACRRCLQGTGSLRVLTPGQLVPGCCQCLSHSLPLLRTHPGSAPLHRMTASHWGGGVGTDGSTGNCCVSHSPFFVCFHKSRKALLAPTRPPARPSVHIGWSRHRGVGWKCC